MGSTAELSFDDLTAPQLTDVQRQILEHTESRHVDLDIDRMVAEAVAEAGPTTSPRTTVSGTGLPPTSGRSTTTAA